MITDYDSLVSEIEDWLHRNDVNAAAKTAIQLFESRWNRTMKAVDMEERQTALTGDEYLGLPSGFIAMRNLQLNTSHGKVPISIKPPRWIDDNYDSTTPGEPEVAAIVGGELQLAPAPDQEYTIEMSFYTGLTALSDSNSTNWLLDLFPDLYFWGSLWAVFGYTMNDARAQMVAAAYIQFRDEFLEYDEAKKWGTQSLQVQKG